MGTTWHCAAQEDLAIRIVLILENIVLWAFLAALAYIFRHALSALPAPECNTRTIAQEAASCWCTSLISVRG